MKLATMILNVLAEISIRNAIHPKLRAWLLRAFGADIGKNVRVHKCQFMNFELGFKNLHIEDGAFIGTDVLLDLAGVIHIGKNSTISARSILMSHSDPGTSHGNYFSTIYPASKNGLVIKEDCWIGTGAIILDGSHIAERCMIAAGCVIVGDALEADSMYAGVPGKLKKKFNSRLPLAHQQSFDNPPA